MNKQRRNVLKTCSGAALLSLLAAAGIIAPGMALAEYLKVSEMKFRLGERFELRLKDVHQNQTGFYRCINTKKGARISNIYFVEVFTQQKLVSVR